MPLTGFHCPGEPWSVATQDDCDKCQDPCMPIELTRLVRAHGLDPVDHYHANPMVISVTETLGCLRKAYYNKTVDYTEELKKLLPRVTGTIIHKAIEDAQVDDCSEVQLGRQLSNGYSLMGSVDRLSDTIKDWKTVDRPRKTVSERDIRQLNTYRLMSKRKGEVPMEVIQLSRKDFAIHEIPEMDNALDDAVERAEMLIEALVAKDVDLLPKEGPTIKINPRCTECWGCPHVALCKPEEVGG